MTPPAVPAVPHPIAVTGVHVVDAHRRVLILEGLAGRGAAAVRAAVGPRAGLNDARFHLLANASVRFHTRLFTPFRGAAPVTDARRAVADA